MEEQGEVKVSQVDTQLTVTSQALRSPHAPGTHDLGRGQQRSGRAT